MKSPSFFYPVFLLILFTLACVSGCLHGISGISDQSPITTKNTLVTDIPEPVQLSLDGKPAFQQERITPGVKEGILQSVTKIPYLSMNEDEKKLCIRSDPRGMVSIMLTDSNAQDMLMKGGRITGIGPYLPRSAKTAPSKGICTTAVHISARNITSMFVIDQEQHVVSQQVIEVPESSRISTSGNRTIISSGDNILFVFGNERYRS